MSEDEVKKIFSKNLKHYMEINDKKQIDLMNDLNLSSSTLSNWCTGTKMPRMDKVQMLADYFGILKSDLIEDKKNSESSTLNNQIKELMSEKNGIYFRLAKEAKNLDLDEEDIETILKIYAKHRERNM